MNKDTYIQFGRVVWKYCAVNLLMWLSFSKTKNHVGKKDRKANQETDS